jgi:hypothetical protein
VAQMSAAQMSRARHPFQTNFNLRDGRQIGPIFHKASHEVNSYSLLEQLGSTPLDPGGLRQSLPRAVDQNKSSVLLVYHPGDRLMARAATLLTPELDGPGGVMRSMRDVVRAGWAGAASYQRLLYLGGVLLVASGLFHVVVLVAAGGSWEGPVSWRKPILFGLSGGLTMISLAWVMGYLPRRRLPGWLLAGLFGLLVPEVAWVDLQQWRGVRSHFNEGSPFDAALFSITGLMIALVAIGIVVLTLWTLVSLKAPASIALAIRVGMGLLVAGQVFGYLIVANGDAQLVANTGREPNIYGAAGVMKQPHALALHGIQVLGALAWLLLFVPWTERRRLLVCIVAAVGYTGLVVASAVQTFSGRAPLDLSVQVGTLLGTSVVLLVGVSVVTLIGVQRAFGQGTARAVP